ncbi:MAG: hypothetical protein NVS1B4_15660 [Gemmatimonadaceae bacterium]
MTSRLPIALAAVCCAFLAACGDPFAAKATFDNTTDTLQVWALNQPPGTFPYPNALFTPTRSIVRAEQGQPFDIAFDVGVDGRARFLPNRRVLGALAFGHAVGIQRSGVAFDSVLIAPSTGFVYDSVTSGVRGETFILQTSASGFCSYYAPSQVIYAKFVIDSVRIRDRTVFIRLRTDPNCGFRSLGLGRPRD